jgi:hypothetical protein
MGKPEIGRFLSSLATDCLLCGHNGMMQISHNGCTLTGIYRQRSVPKRLDKCLETEENGVNL